MAAEGRVDAELTRALEEVEGALRAERRALEPLSGKSTVLRARIEQLRAERDKLLRELESPRQEQVRRYRRLPEVLLPPFEIRHWTYGGRLPPEILQDAWPMLALTGVILIQWLTIFLAACGLFLAMHAWDLLPERAWWYFDETGIGRGRKAAGRTGRVLYSEITRVEVHVTGSQRQRGVGTVQVEYTRPFMQGAERWLTLKDVPDPEHLAEWIERKRSGVV